MTTISVAVDATTVANSLTAAGYTVTAPGAVVTPPVVTPPANGVPKLLVVIAQNGAQNPAWIRDWSFSAVANKMVPGAGNGNAFGIHCITTGPWGGYQPSNDNGNTTDFSGCSHITIDVNAPKGNAYQIAFLQGGDQPIPGNPCFRFVKTVDGYERFSCLRDVVMKGNDGVDYSSKIFKAQVDSQQGTTGDQWNVDNWGGVT